MKGILKYIITFSVLSGIVSCAYNEDMLQPDSNGDSTLVIASVENFSRHNVTTKATDEQETTVKDIAVLLFGLVDGQYQRIADPIFVSGSSLNYVINTSKKYIANIQDGESNYKYFTSYTGTKCRLYIVANMNSKLNPATDKPDLSTEAAFLDVAYTLPYHGDNNEMTSVGAPEKGFPMIGSADLTLGNNSSETINVSMRKLFAKINVRFRVQVDGENNPDHMSNVQKPYFKPSTWSVHNVPSSIKLQVSDSLEYPGIDVFSTVAHREFVFGPESVDDGKVEHSTSSDEYLEISFYMPEYRIAPAKHKKGAEYPYPANIDNNSKQFYKPLLCDGNQKPTYVQITGTYSNHQGHPTDVTYKLYLGQDETDNFQILRNQELNNYVTVKGLTNHDGAKDATISADHRVHIDAQGFSIAMERETLLDSHFEFRPMDITVQEGATVKIEIPAEADWLAAERAEEDYWLGEDSEYDPSKPGLRKFFKTNLIQELKNAEKSDDYFILTGPDDDGNSATVKTETYKLWFYFDEFVNSEIPPYDASQPTSETNQLYRDAQIKVTFIDSDPSTEDQVRIFTFRQMNLWAINVYEDENKENLLRTYSIEYFEEYLYNYASDDGYDVVQDGMEWGLEGQQLSTKYQAIYADSGNSSGFLELLGILGLNSTDFYNKTFNGIDTDYDFYLTRDEPPAGATIRNFAGLEFTQELINQGKLLDDNGNITSISIAANDRLLSQSKKIQSAVEYCYNKNKRNPTTGKVEKINWYLPAIDQTEEILLAGFDYFPVFQSKYYWSSQPAYKLYDYDSSVTGKYINIDIGRATGTYYKDNRYNARATKVTENENEIFLSGVSGKSGIFPIELRVTDYKLTWNGIEVEAVVESGPEDEREYGPEDGNLYTPENKIYQPGNQPRSTPNRVRCVYNATGLPVSPTTTN